MRIENMSIKVKNIIMYSKSLIDYFSKHLQKIGQQKYILLLFLALPFLFKILPVNILYVLLNY